MLGLCQSMMDTLIGLGPVQMGQVGQTGPAAPNAILGKDNSCQNGPSYWCASPENARECKVITVLIHSNYSTLQYLSHIIARFIASTVSVLEYFIVVELFNWPIH